MLTWEDVIAQGDPCSRALGDHCWRAMLTRKEVERLLDDLCVKLGFCLPPEAYGRLAEAPPTSVDDFTRAVFEAEGWDPVMADRRLVREVEAMIANAFDGRESERERKG